MTNLLNAKVLFVWIALTVVIVIRPVVGGDVLYDYDSLGRLIEVTYSDGAIVIYDYDALGNRIVHTTSGISNQAPEITSTPNTSAIVGSDYTYDANNQVEASGVSPISFSLGSGPDGFSVASDGQVSWTPSVSQEGVHAVEIIASNSAGAVSQSFNISVDPATLNFNDFTLDIYGGSQDSSGTVAVEDSGASVRLVGNRWQQIQIDYTVMANTVLEFDFSSSALGDVHGIGFDTDLGLTDQFTFQLFGTQTWGLQDFHNYALNDGIKHYVIPVGQFYTGFMAYLFFVNDHDVNNPNAESLFSNIKVYEVSENIPPVFTSTPVTRARVAIAYAYDANKRVEASGAAPISFSLGSGPDGVIVASDGQVSWTPSVGQEGVHAVEIIATNSAGSVSQSFNITVDPATPANILNFNDYALGSYGGSQDSSGTVTVEDNGISIRLVGNRWQQIPIDYTVTANTVLEFDFSSSAQADVHGIGFDKDLQLSALFTFQLYGTQNWGAQDFHNYTLNNGVRHYVIPVGQFYTAFVPNHTGLMPYLFFSNDHDVSNPDGESVFSNIKIYEDTGLFPPEFTSIPNIRAREGNVYFYDANKKLEAGGSPPISFSLGSGPDGFTVTSDGQVSWTPSLGQEGVHAVEIIASNSSGTVSQSFNITVDPVTLNFNGFTLGSYGGSSQDLSGTVTVEDGGTSVRLVGNRWQQIQVDHTVTTNTVLEFDFSSSAQADVHGIGFDTDLGLTEQFAFQLFGTQVWGVQDIHNYTLNDGVKHYVIPVGQYYTGFMSYLFFSNDHDVNTPNGESLFSNIKVYEVSDDTLPTFISTPNTLTRVSNTYFYDANRRVEASGAVPISFSLGSAPTGFNVDSNGQVRWTPSVGQEGVHAVEIIASNSAGAVSQSFNITVDPVTLNFNDFTLGSYGGSQDSSGTVAVEDGGASVRLVGNRWQQIQIDHTVAANTVLEFDFSSSAQGDVHGIGFDTDLGLTAQFAFQLFGTQTWGEQDFYNYILNDGIKHYVIPVGQFYSGFMPYLFFANDHDVNNPNAESVFSNIQIHE